MIIRRATELGAAFVLAAGLLAGCREGAPERVALVGATVIDGSGGPELDDAIVILHGGEIETVAAREGFEIPRRTRRIDVTGKWIMPGLIDAHAHADRWALPRYLAWGVTSLRDVHGQHDSIFQLRDDVNLGSIPGPRMFIAGAMIDGAPATYPSASEVTSGPEARRVVDALAVDGADFVKTYTRITPELMEPLVDEASALQLRVTAHLGLTDALRASSLGVRAIEHLSGIPEAALANPAALLAAHRRSFFEGWTAFEAAWAGIDSTTLSRLAGRLANDRVFMIPTLVLHDTYSRLDDKGLYQDPDLVAVPDSIQRAWNVAGMVQRAGWTERDFANFRASRANQDLFLREFLRQGGVVVAGTDAANQMLIPGRSEHRELELLVQAGVPPREALLTATRNAARLLGADSLGAVAPGRVADLLVLSRNPLEDIRNTASIDFVVLRGQVMSADSIRQGWGR